MIFSHMQRSGDHLYRVDVTRSIRIPNLTPAFGFQGFLWILVTSISMYNPISSYIIEQKAALCTYRRIRSIFVSYYVRSLCVLLRQWSHGGTLFLNIIMLKVMSAVDAHLTARLIPRPFLPFPLHIHLFCLFSAEKKSEPFKLDVALADLQI